MKPIAKTMDTIIRIYNRHDDEVFYKVTQRGTARMTGALKRMFKMKNSKLGKNEHGETHTLTSLGYSFTVDSRAYNSKYCIWYPIKSPKATKTEQ